MISTALVVLTRSTDRAAAATPPANFPITGIDIADYQDIATPAGINWAQVAQSRQFAYIKATEGTGYTNKYYAGDMKGALGAGMYAGAYAFARLDQPNPAAQADYLLNFTSYNSGIGGHILPPFIDVETGGAVNQPTCYNQTPAQISSWLHAFANEFQARAGRLPVIYTSTGFWGACMQGDKTMGSLPLDVASWFASSPSIPVSWAGSSFTFWQYSDNDVVPGINGSVDGDVFNGTLGQLAAFAAARPGTQTKTLLGDVDGDGKADLVTNTGDSTFVALSNGSSFGIPVRWSTSLFFGSVTTLLADVNGDGKADLVAVNKDNVYVELSDGKSFGAPQPWWIGPFYGAKATLMADVNGDGQADLIAVNAESAWVALSTKTGFAPPTVWSPVPFYGSRATLAADVSGDGRADLIAVNDSTTWVSAATVSSTGVGSFLAPVPWSTSPFYGSYATLAGDLNGDKKADLIAVNGVSTWVMSSTGTSFAVGAPASATLFRGTLSMAVADVNGDKVPDLVAVNPDSVWVMPASSTGYGPPQPWW